MHHLVPNTARFQMPDLNRWRYQSITQQYLKRCLIKDDSNYMFRPIAAIIRFSSESMVVVLYRIGMDMSRWWDLSTCDVCYMLLLRGTGGVCDVRYSGVCSSSMSACLCPMWVSSYCLSISDVCPFPMSSSWRSTQDISEQTYLSCTPQDSAYHKSPPSPCPLTIAYNKHHRCWDLTIVTYPYQSCKALPPYFLMKTWWWPH